VDPLQPYTVAAIPWSQIKRILYGLAYSRTLAMKCSQITEHYDNIFYVPGLQQLQPSSLSMGDNVADNPQLMERMVKEEMTTLVNRFHAFLRQNKKDMQAIVDWINGANKARRLYAKTYQEKLDDLNRTTAQMGKALFFSMATAAATECAAEVVLTCVGLGGGTQLGEMSINFAARRISFSAATKLAPMTVALASKKAAVGIGAGITVSFCDRWTQAGSADMFGVFKENTVSNLPGWVSDVLDPFLAGFNDMVIAAAREAARDHANANNFGALRAFALEGKAAQLAEKGAGSLGKVANLGALGLASFFAVVSIYGSYSKLAGRVNQN
jgi:hypothetical protein